MSKKQRASKKEPVNKTEEIKKDKSPKIPQRDKLKQELTIFHREDITERQKEFLKIILDKKTNVVFLKGAAGTSKTWLSVYAGLISLSSKLQSDILFIRAPVEVGKSIGHLPGTEQEKINAYLVPLYDKVEELIPRGEAEMLLKDNRLTGTVPNFLRGQNWNARFVIVDEAQNMDPASMKVIISRLGRYGKLIILADENQADLRGSVEFMRYFDLFNNDESKEYGIHCLSFKREDIVRSPILGYILDKIEGVYSPPTKQI
jgi:phosphate starvation-inducible PhoH-like protein